MKRFGITALVICMMLVLCACGGSDEVPAATEAPTTQATVVETTEAVVEEEATVPEGMISYTVTVVDEEGTPVAGAMVQLCKDSCIPGVTNDAGVAAFRVYEDDYKVSMLMMPEGYAYAGEEEEFYFETGSYELTIVLKPAA